jgi:hypothetical protein
MGWINRIVRRILGKGDSSPPPKSSTTSGGSRGHSYPSMPKPFAGVTAPASIPSDEDKKNQGQYGQSYPKGQRTNNQAGQAPTNDQIPDRQKFESPYSTWVASFLWERYRGSKVIGGGEGTITIEFVNGTVCQYKALSYKLFKDFAVAPSKGQFVNAFFRPKPYVLIKKGTKKVKRRTPHIGHKMYPKSGQNITRGTP